MKPFISTAVTMPDPATFKSNARGNQSKYPFGDLKVGVGSIAVLDKEAKQLSSTISTANKKEWPAVDAKGKPVMTDIKNPVDGAVVKQIQKTETRKFAAQPCDPATDPDKATARIWRIA